MSSDEQFVENSGSPAYLGLIPAAGIGSRLPNRKLSKEILPVGTQTGQERPAIAHLLQSMTLATVRRVKIVVREDKHDLLAYLANAEWQQMQFDTQLTAGTTGVPATVALGLDPLPTQNIVFGFPDILFAPENALASMIGAFEQSDADVMLGLFPTDNPQKMDMVDINEHGRVKEIEIKPAQTSLALTWILAVWNQTFSKFLVENVNRDPGIEHLGHVFQRSIAAGMHIGSTSFPHGKSLDIGTPDDLARAGTWRN